MRLNWGLPTTHGNQARQGSWAQPKSAVGCPYAVLGAALQGSVCSCYVRCGLTMQMMGGDLRVLGPVRWSVTGPQVLHCPCTAERGSVQCCWISSSSFLLNAW